MVFDAVGGASTEAAFRSIAWRGRHLIVGFASGPIPSLAMNLPLLKGAALIGVMWGGYLKREPENWRAALAEMLRLASRRPAASADLAHLSAGRRTGRARRPHRAAHDRQGGPGAVVKGWPVLPLERKRHVQRGAGRHQQPLGVSVTPATRPAAIAARVCARDAVRSPISAM